MIRYDYYYIGFCNPPGAKLFLEMEMGFICISDTAYGIPIGGDRKW